MLQLKFADGERDMVAMFHSITGKLPDGTFERHESRLLTFGKPGGDTSMSETVGYTTAAATELLLFQQLKNRTGVIIPITSDIYDPVLERIQTAGVTWTDSISKY